MLSNFMVMHAFGDLLDTNGRIQVAGFVISPWAVDQEITAQPCWSAQVRLLGDKGWQAFMAYWVAASGKTKS